jgi:hypothetical protein
MLCGEIPPLLKVRLVLVCLGTGRTTGARRTTAKPSGRGATRKTAARRTTARRSTSRNVQGSTLDNIEKQIKKLPANLRRGSASWLRSARKIAKDKEARQRATTARKTTERRTAGRKSGAARRADSRKGAARRTTGRQATTRGGRSSSRGQSASRGRLAERPPKDPGEPYPTGPRPGRR